MDVTWALWQTWPKTCTDCDKPLLWPHVEVDHFIPKGLSPADITKAHVTHGLDADFNILGYENLRPLHPKCNETRSRGVPSSNGLSTKVLNFSRAHASKVERLVKTMRDSTRFASQLGALQIVDVSGASEESKTAWRNALEELTTAAGVAPNLLPLRRHPGIAGHSVDPNLYILDQSMQGQWDVIDARGRRGTAEADSYGFCPACELHTAWNSLRCERCGYTRPPRHDFDN